jgi:hypothetical protein
MNVAPTYTGDKRALLSQISGRKVREIASEKSPYAAALYGVVHERRSAWTGEQWAEVIDELDNSTLTVGAFLTQEAAR